MTWYFSFIGDADDPDFHWDNPGEAYRTGHLPRRLFPHEPHRDLGVSIFPVMKLAKSGAYEGQQIDWGAWALKMTGAQLREFLAGRPYADELASLDPGRIYLLVAAEGG